MHRCVALALGLSAGACGVADEPFELDAPADADAVAEPGPATPAEQTLAIEQLPPPPKAQCLVEGRTTLHLFDEHGQFFAQASGEAIVIVPAEPNVAAAATVQTGRAEISGFLDFRFADPERECEFLTVDHFDGRPPEERGAICNLYGTVYTHPEHRPVPHHCPQPMPVLAEQTDRWLEVGTTSPGEQGVGLTGHNPGLRSLAVSDYDLSVQTKHAAGCTKLLERNPPVE